MSIIVIYDKEISQKYYDLFSKLKISEYYYCKEDLEENLKNYLNYLNNKNDYSFKFKSDVIQTIFNILEELYELKIINKDENIIQFIDLYFNYIINFIINNKIKIIDDIVKIRFKGFVYLYFSICNIKNLCIKVGNEVLIDNFLILYSEKINDHEEMKIIFKFINRIK